MHINAFKMHQMSNFTMGTISGMGFAQALPMVKLDRLQTPNEAFYHQNPELLGLGRQLRRINLGIFGVFSAKLSTHVSVQ